MTYDFKPNDTKEALLYDLVSNNDLHIIGVSAPKGAGKSTTCSNVKSMLNTYHKDKFDNILILSFAKFLKTIVHMTLEDECVEKELRRKYYQIIGDAYRTVDIDYFVKALLVEISEKINPNEKTLVLIDDVRFPNEASVCKEMFCFETSEVKYTNEHISESYVGSYHYWLLDNHHDVEMSLMYICSNIK